MTDDVELPAGGEPPDAAEQPVLPGFDPPPVSVAEMAAVVAPTGEPEPKGDPETTLPLWEAGPTPEPTPEPASPTEPAAEAIEAGSLHQNVPPEDVLVQTSPEALTTPSPAASPARHLQPSGPASLAAIPRAMLGELAVIVLALILGITAAVQFSSRPRRPIRVVTAPSLVPTPTATVSPSDTPSPSTSPTPNVSAAPAPRGPAAPGPVALGPPPPGDPAPAESTVVYVNGPATIQVYSAPDEASSSQTLKGHNSIDQPSVFLVVDQQPGWYHVLIPVKPNGSTGWVRASDVQVTTNRNYLRVSISQFRIDLYTGGAWQKGYRVAVGKPSTPTPPGHYYILGSQAVGQAPYTPGIFALSGFAPQALPGFLGATLGIHGWTDPSVIGTRVSNGCVRLASRDMDPLLHSLLLGTPVDIVS